MSRLRALLTMLVLPLLAATVTGQDQPRPLPVFVFAGQSNMVGSGEVDQLPAEFQERSTQVLVVDNWRNPRRWVPFQPSGRIGPEVSFCHAMAESMGEPIGMIKVAVGGSNLARQWHPEGDNNFYASLVEQVTAAARLRPMTVVAMLWMQGERDSRSEEMAAAYDGNLRLLVESARRDFNAPEMIFVCGRINPKFPVGEVLGRPPQAYAHVFVVRQAQMELDLPRVGWVDCDDLSKHSDVLHYDTNGVVELGNRMAERTGQLMRGD